MSAIMELPSLSLLTFSLLIVTLISLWVYRSILVWGALLLVTLVAGFYAGHITLVGLLCTAGLIALFAWFKARPFKLLFGVLVIAGFVFGMKLLPCFPPYRFTTHFAIGLQGALPGLLAMALIVPLARSNRDWVGIVKGIFYGCLGITVLAVAATYLGVVRWQFQLPPLAFERFLVNFFFTCIPEEGFFRGFFQARLALYFRSGKLGKLLALLTTSVLFTLGHLFWTSSGAILGFVFLASLLYGGVYLISKRIESAIVTHFLLNFIHMTFFSYHAL